MATNCSWCGKRVGFADMSFTYERVGDEDHCICGACSELVASAKNGSVAFEQIATVYTRQELLSYFMEQADAADDQERESNRKKQEQRKIKQEAQDINPLYDDIHQIAGDLRFIKNYLIFCIVAGAIAAFVWLLSIL